MCKILFFLLISQVFSTLIYKREVPFGFLATRTRPVTKFYEFREFFGDAIQTAYDTNCAGPKLRCYFPIAKQNDILVYTMLTETPNYNCSSYPYCIGFNQSQYQNYSIVFSDTDVLPEDFILPNCTASQFSFTRPNGLNWCFNISKNGDWLTHDEAEAECASQNSSLNGFQTIEEQDYFRKAFRITRTGEKTFVHLGATRNCTEDCKNKNADGCIKEMAWTSSIISTNQTLANNINSGYLDCIGKNLVLRSVKGNLTYDDTKDDNEGYYSCGWYAV
ncbi:unnamed protein product [Caenorhabditis angaria]|uniref:C-type lectin domain-containing protein n=1 Tax=Caenorhabditis angaria TaxID=860376 RepID=A0A9P1N3R5_9PELO|nr:unnamed protein product [Caenorhabditis angaria]